MTWIDYSVIAAVILIVGLAAAYIIRAKRKGQKCIGYPYASACGKTTCGCSRMPSNESEEQTKQ